MDKLSISKPFNFNCTKEILSFFNLKKLITTTRILNKSFNNEKTLMEIIFIQMSKSSLNAVKRHNNIFEEIKESTLNLIKDKFEYLDIYPQFSYQNFQNSNVNYLDFLHEVINLHKDLIYPYSCYNKNYHNKVNEKIKAKKFYNFVDVLSLQPVEVSSNWDTEQTLSNLLIKKLAWSPKGVTNPDDCKEYFIFKTLYPLCIIQAFEISFQKYSYAPNDINGCESIRISIGLTTDDFYFISDIIPLKKTFNKQMFNFQNILIIGSYIKVEFFKPYTIWSKKEDNELLKIKHKKYFKDADNLFYIAVGSFYVYGLEIREDKDELHPKYSKIRKILETYISEIYVTQTNELKINNYNNNFNDDKRVKDDKVDIKILDNDSYIKIFGFEKYKQSQFYNKTINDFNNIKEYLKGEDELNYILINKFIDDNNLFLLQILSDDESHSYIDNIDILNMFTSNQKFIRFRYNAINNKKKKELCFNKLNDFDFILILHSKWYNSFQMDVNDDSNFIPFQISNPILVNEYYFKYIADDIDDGMFKFLVMFCLSNKYLNQYPLISYLDTQNSHVLGPRFLAELVSMSDRDDFDKIKEQFEIEDHYKIIFDVMIILEKEYGYKLTSIRCLNKHY